MSPRFPKVLWCMGSSLNQLKVRVEEKTSAFPLFLLNRVIQPADVGSTSIRSGELMPLLRVPPSHHGTPTLFSRGATSSISNRRDVCSKPWSSGSCVVVST
jgi:hypothetical protein